MSGAGSANLASYMGGQKGRNFQFYYEYSSRKEYMGKKEFLLRHSFINLDYVYGTLSVSGGENPLDYEKMAQNPMEWYIAGTDAITGKSRFFDRKDIHQDDYNILKASCAIPFVCKPRFIDGVPYYDGALGNPVPIEKAFQDGCDKVILILTKPVDEILTPGTDEKLAKLIRRKYPKAARQLELRAAHYNEGVALAQKYAQEGKVLIIAPDDTCGVATLTRDKTALKNLYDKGYRDGAAISDFM